MNWCDRGEQPLGDEPRPTDDASSSDAPATDATQADAVPFAADDGATTATTTAHDGGTTAASTEDADGSGDQGDGASTGIADCHIVALMHGHGVREIVTHDRDLRRFDGVKVRDPFVD